MMDDTVYIILMDGSTMQGSTLETSNSGSGMGPRNNIFNKFPQSDFDMQVSLTWVLN